ncbi:MAG: DUF1292 domain-containing protein [Pirellulaceae bacterium]
MTDQEPQLVTLTGDDGSEIECQLLDIISFEDREYAVLLADDGVIIMGMVESSDGSHFQTIEDDEEFERVAAYVRELAETQSEN